MKPVNVFPLLETILHWSDWLRQGLVAYYRSLTLQVCGLFNSENPLALARQSRLMFPSTTVSLILLSATVFATPTETPNTSAVAETQSVVHAQQDAWNRGDIDGFMNGYARSPSTVFVSEDEVRRGWETVRERYREKYSDRTKMGTLSFSDIEITPLSSDSAVVLGRWSLKRANDQPHGRFTLIFKHFPEGWRIVHDHTSAAPPPMR
jgi:ketosteroid isomerase-like protein